MKTGAGLGGGYGGCFCSRVTDGGGDAGVLVLVVVNVIGGSKGLMLVVGNGGVQWWMWHVVCVGCGCC